MFILILKEKIMKIKNLILAVCLALPSTMVLASELDAVEVKDLTFMREEEKMARDVYTTLYSKWRLPVFSNIASSEFQHMSTMLQLLNKYSLPDPVGTNPVGVFTDPELQSLYTSLVAQGKTSKVNALKVGGLIEETDMQDIVEAMDRNDQPDIETAYGNLLCGSRNHLRSFASNIKKITGKPYVAQLLTQEEVDEIITTPNERCGR